MIEPEQRQALLSVLAAFGEHAGRQLLAQLGTPSAAAEFDRLVDLRVAVTMLNAGSARSDVCARLMRRGLSQSTSYRVVSAALDARHTIFLTAPASLGSGRAILHGTQPLQEPDSMSTAEAATTVALHNLAPVQALAEKLAGLRAEHQAIDLARLRQAVVQAEAAHDAVRKMSPANILAKFVNADRYQQVLSAARSTQINAQRHFDEAQLQHARLGQEIESLEALLGAQDRAERAKQLLAEAPQEIADAEQAVSDAEVAIDRIGTMISEAEANFDGAKATAAAAVLAAVKSGSSASKIATPNRDRIETLLAAKVTAGQELDAARAGVAKAMQRREQARAELRDANALLRKLAEHVARDAYQQALQSFLGEHVDDELADA